ncbi:MAG: N-acetylmuramoyl-L-alanine amidase [Selenomonadaceae bacterium]|nr:N-acetylmuramoyl-L-alanine amidase [Selenomonadaceae bacterium]
MKIFINAGHGGNDPGACGNGLRESDVALSIGKLTEKYLKAVGYDVKLFQYDGLQTICDVANDWCADLFVSIHCNAGGGTGTETYYFQGSANGETLAAYVQKQIVKSLPVVNRGVKHANFYVLKYTDMPAVLVETAFIDNFLDAKLLRDRQDDFARAIARGISDFYAFPKPDVIDFPTRH